MPQFSFHQLVATKVVEAGRLRGSLRGVIDVGDAEQCNAFRHGAIAPDMGFFPGGDRWLSAAAHGVRSGDLVRRLFATARTPTQRAFAHGWLTHMLADVTVHPLINGQAAELMEREGRVACESSAAARLHAHVRVEFGVDVSYVRCEPWLGEIRLRPFVDRDVAQWIASAYRAVHRIDADPASVLRSHRQVLRWQRPLLVLERWMATRLAPVEPRSAAQDLDRTGRPGRAAPFAVIAPTSMASAFLSAVDPAPALLRALDGVIAGFASSYGPFMEHQLRTDVNYCLDTGEPSAQRESERWESERRSA